VQGGSTVASGTWDGAAQLTSYNDAAGNMSAATYDGNGLRATATSGAGSQSFVWNYVSSIPQVIMDSGSACIYTLGVAPAEQVNLSTGAITYLITDSLGSVRGVVSGSGSLTATTSYDAWGNPETSGGLSASTQFGYAGGYTDPTGLVYLINRYYDPATGQFMSADPALAQTTQPYTYASANPVSMTEPNGASTLWCSAGRGLRYCYRYYSEYETQDIIWEYYMVAWGLASMAVVSLFFSPAAAFIVGILSGGVGAVGAYINKIDNQGHNRGIYIGMIQVQAIWWWFGWHYGWYTTWEWLGHR
jgi:RHS repeat-associated protein